MTESGCGETGVPTSRIGRFDGFFMSEFLSDLSVTCGGVTWPAHKVFLATGSVVFMRMFESGMKEDKKGQIIIVDSDPDVVYQMLHYLYKGKCDIEESKTSSTMLVDLLKLAHMYEIEGLRVWAVGSIVREITMDNAAELYSIADMYGQNAIMRRALQVAKANRGSFCKDAGHLKELLDTYPAFIFQLFNMP